MSNREAKLQARQWVETPEIFAEDLRRRLVDVERLSPRVSEDDDAMNTADRRVEPALAQELLAAVEEYDNALWEYRRLVPETQVRYRMFQPLIEVARQALDSKISVDFSGYSELEDAVAAVEKWARRQLSRTTDIPLRSELLRASIEPLGDELIVRTDQDGSIKLRGAVNIPMFLAFWRAPKHRLGMDAFLEIDPGSKHTYLERHRTRLCSQLQDILLELVVDGNSVRLQRCRK